MKITQRDPSNGIVEHFVVNKGKLRGCWISSEHIDVSGLIIDAYNRRQNQLDRRQMYLKRKEKTERMRKATEIALRVKEEDSREKAALEEKTIEEAKAKAVMKANIEAKARVERQMLKSSKKKSRVLQNEPVPTTNMQQEINQWNENSKAILMQHQIDLAAVTQHCLKMAIYPIPPSTIENMRNATITRLQHAASTLRSLNVMQVKDECIADIVISCEKEMFQNASPQNFHASSAIELHEKMNNSGISQENPVFLQPTQFGDEQQAQPQLLNSNLHQARRQPHTPSAVTVGHVSTLNATSNFSSQVSPPQPDQRGGGNGGINQNSNHPSPFEANPLESASRYLQHGLSTHNAGMRYDNGENSYETEATRSQGSSQVWHGRDNQAPSHYVQMNTNGMQQAFNQRSAPLGTFAASYFGTEQPQICHIQQPNDFAQQQVAHFSNTPFGYSPSMPQPFMHNKQQGFGSPLPNPQPLENSYQEGSQSFVISGGQQAQQFQQAGQPQNVQALQMELQRLQYLRQLQQMQQQNSQYQGPTPHNPFW